MMLQAVSRGLRTNASAMPVPSFRRLLTTAAADSSAERRAERLRGPDPLQRGRLVALHRCDQLLARHRRQLRPDGIGRQLRMHRSLTRMLCIVAAALPRFPPRAAVRRE